MSNRFQFKGGYQVAPSKKHPDRNREWVRQISNRHPLLKPEQERDLIARAQAGDIDAANKIVLSNIRLVARIANKVNNRGIPVDDLIMAGITGLIRSIGKFDLDAGTRLSTYATPWILQYVRRCIEDQSSVIRIRNQPQRDIAKVLKAALEVEAKLGRKPTNQEIAEAMGLTEAKVNEFYRNASVTIVPLDAPFITAEEDRPPLSDIVADEEASQDMTLWEIRAAIEEILSRALTPLQREVLVLRLGIGGDKPMTLVEIAKLLDVSPNTVRNTENSALKRLREEPDILDVFRSA